MKNITGNKTRKHTGRKIVQKLIIVLTVILLSAGGVFVVQATPSSKLQTNQIRVKCYKSIEVCPGDSLWSIAKRHMTEEYDSVYAYISEIYKLNELTSENLTAGTRLMVVCYENFEKDFFAERYE